MFLFVKWMASKLFHSFVLHLYKECNLLQKWKAISFDLSQEAGLQLTSATWQTSWNVINADLNPFFSTIFKAFLIVKRLCVVNRWEFEESEEDPVTSIPYQLQRLFVLLQTSKKRAIETTDVTRSFGWDSSEGNVQLLSLCHLLQHLSFGGLNCCQWRKNTGKIIIRIHLVSLETK